jgi:tryptophanyl-tRNA synthetase
MRKRYPNLIDLISESFIEEKTKKNTEDEDAKTVEEELKMKYNPDDNMAMGYHKLLHASIKSSQDKAKAKCEKDGGEGEAKFHGPFTSKIDGKKYVVCTMKKKVSETLSRGSLYRKRYYGRY